VISRKRAIIAVLILGVAVSCLFLLVPFPVYRECAFADTNTGSRKGHRAWFFGAETRQWYQTSALETFMRTNAPMQLEHRWVSYRGTGFNIFGGKVLFGHGRAGPILQLKPEDIAEWCALVDDREKRAFYDVLRSGDKDTIKVKITSIWDQLFARRDTQN
jgi:hypothetical protein